MTAPPAPPAAPPVLPIEEIRMPAGDVSDLQDVFDAINRLCDTMKSSTYSDSGPPPANGAATAGLASEPDLDEDAAAPVVCDLEVAFSVESDSDVTLSLVCDTKCDADVNSPVVNNDNAAALEPMDGIANTLTSVRVEEIWSSAPTSPPESERRADDAGSDSAREPLSEMYYTASSEVSLLSDEAGGPGGPAGGLGEPAGGLGGPAPGHVAAMRERFESMTRANTPCPDALDLSRNITPSPDALR